MNVRCIRDAQAAADLQVAVLNVVKETAVVLNRQPLFSLRRSCCAYDSRD